MREAPRALGVSLERARGNLAPLRGSSAAKARFNRLAALLSPLRHSPSFCRTKTLPWTAQGVGESAGSAARWVGPHPRGGRATHSSPAAPRGARRCSDAQGARCTSARGNAQRSPRGRCTEASLLAQPASSSLDDALLRATLAAHSSAASTFTRDGMAPESITPARSLLDKGEPHTAKTRARAPRKSRVLCASDCGARSSCRAASNPLMTPARHKCTTAA